MINEYQNLYICGSQPWVRVLQRYVRNPKGYAKKFKVVNETAINALYSLTKGYVSFLILFRGAQTENGWKPLLYIKPKISSSSSSWFLWVWLPK